MEVDLVVGTVTLDPLEVLVPLEEDFSAFVPVLLRRSSLKKGMLASRSAHSHSRCTPSFCNRPRTGAFIGVVGVAGSTWDRSLRPLMLEGLKRTIACRPRAG